MVGIGLCVGKLSMRIWVFFFFKQKTAYEMLRSLVGSEMCIRDSDGFIEKLRQKYSDIALLRNEKFFQVFDFDEGRPCLLYTSDAADDLLCVDLGGRRIIKKKTILPKTLHTNTIPIHTILILAQ